MGSRQTLELDQSNPISDIYIHLNLKFSTAPVIASSFSNIARLDSILNAVRRVQLACDDGTGSTNKVDISGLGLLEWNLRNGESLTRSTHELAKFMQLGAGTTIGANNDLLRLTYHIPMVHQKITENLRTRCLLPAHILSSEPQLIIDFENISTMFPSTGTIATALCDVEIVRRRMPKSMTAAIQAKGGFIDWDLLETPKVVAAAQKQMEFKLPTGGSYTGVMLRNYLLASSVYTRDPLDDTSTFGQESRWILDIGGQKWADFRMHNMFAENEIAQDEPRYGQPVYNGSALYLGASTGTFATGVDIRTVLADPCAYPFLGTSGNGAQTSRFQAAGNVYFDFIGGENDADVYELGSLLDTNAIKQAGTDAKFVGDVTTGQMNIVGHRLFGDLSAFQDMSI